MAQYDEAAAPGGALTVALLDTLLHTAPVGLGFVDADLRFVRVNEMLAAMNGAPVEAHLGRRVDEVLSERLCGTVVPILRRTLDTGTPSPEIEVANEDRRWVISYYPVHEGDDANPVGVGVVVRDITDETRIARELAVRALHLEAVAQLGQRALISDDFDELVSDGVARLVEILGIDYVHVLRHDRDASEFVLQYAFGFEETLGRRIPDDVSLQPGYALHNRTPVKIEDPANEHRFQISPIFAALGVASVLVVVIRGPGQPYGTLSLATRTPRSFNPEEVDFVQSMANVLGTAAARAKVDAALRAERLRLQLALDAGGMGDWEWSVADDRVSWSETMFQLFGVDPETFTPTFGGYLEVVHPEDRDRVQDVVAGTIEGDSESYYIEHRIVRPDGSERWIGANGQVRRGDAGQAVGIIGVATDITDRVEADYKQQLLFTAEQEARAEAEAARDRLAFLAEASRVLSRSLDYHETMRQLADLAVSRLADWCAIDVVETEGAAPTTVVVAHVDPDRVEEAEEFRRRYPPDPNSEQGVAAVVRAGEPMLYSEITDEMLAGAAVDEAHLAMLRSLEMRSAMVVPLIARGRALGAMTLVSSSRERFYGEDDLSLAMDLARRAGVAIDNARLYEERSRVAEALQRSLLPPRSPEIPGLEVAVRYRPVGEGTEIGGDFYDVFEAREGLWAVAIGDVCGKGTAAAALTGLARDTIRGVSLRERAPRRVLRVLNEVVLRRDEDRFLTVALAMLEADGAGVRMRVSCGGHPLPLVVRDDGSVEEAGTPGMLLGLFPDVDLVDVHLELAPGDAVVLFTDGVTEAHGPEGLFGEARLRAVLRGMAGMEAEAVAQAVVDAVDAWRPGPPQDDVAVVVLRVPPGG